MAIIGRIIGFVLTLFGRKKTKKEIVKAERLLDDPLSIIDPKDKFQHYLDRRIIGFVMRFRPFVLACMLLLTLFFAFGISQMDFFTQFMDLFPYKHQHVVIHKKFMNNFGGAHVATVVLEVKDGNVFNKETLEKISRIQEAVNLIPGVNPFQIFSLASPRVQDVREIPGGFAMERLMPEIPATPEEMEAFREKVFSNAVFGNLISRDCKALSVSATFIEERIDFEDLYNHFMAIKQAEEDQNHRIYLTGEPILYGWIYHYVPKMTLIFLISTVLIILLLYFYIGRQPYWWIPLVCAAISAIWGLGFASYLGYQFDPLIIVIPFLLSARVMSHGVQWINRFTEEYKGPETFKQVCAKVGESLFNPALIGIMTGAAGVLIVAFIPIPTLKHLAFIGAFWDMTAIFTVVIFLPAAVSCLPAPKRVNGELRHRPSITKMMVAMARFGLGRGKAPLILLAIILFVIGTYGLVTVKIGDANPGSPILWPDSEYNRSVEAIGKRFPGVDQMYIVVAAKKYGALLMPDTLRQMENLQNDLMSKGLVPFGTSSADFVKSFNSLLHGNDPKFGIIPTTINDIVMLFAVYQMGTAPEDMDKWMDYTWWNGNVRLFLPDHKSETLENVIDGVYAFKSDPKNQSELIEFQPAGGLGGILYAANELLKKAHYPLLFGILGFTFLCCAIIYRSISAGFIFTVSLIQANFLAFFYMSWSGIGLDINTIPVVCLGVGLGVDYGLYIVSRIRELIVSGMDWEEAIVEGVKTTGRSVFYQATMMSSSVFFWWFSPLRFQADTGFLLAILMMVNMLMGVLLLPTVLILLKPAFISRGAKRKKKEVGEKPLKESYA